MNFNTDDLPYIELKKQKLPKQWKHWVSKAGLRRESTYRSHWSHFTLRGRDHVFRVNMYGHFQISCPIADFDRWANSAGPSVGTVPKTEAEFLATVKFLITAERSSRLSEQLPDEAAQTSTSLD